MVASLDKRVTSPNVVNPFVCSICQCLFFLSVFVLSPPLPFSVSVCVVSLFFVSFFGYCSCMFLFFLSVFVLSLSLCLCLVSVCSFSQCFFFFCSFCVSSFSQCLFYLFFLLSLSVCSFCSFCVSSFSQRLFLESSDRADTSTMTKKSNNDEVTNHRSLAH